MVKIQAVKRAVFGGGFQRNLDATEKKTLPEEKGAVVRRNIRSFPCKN